MAHHKDSMLEGRHNLQQDLIREGAHEVLLVVNGLLELLHQAYGLPGNGGRLRQHQLYFTSGGFIKPYCRTLQLPQQLVSVPQQPAQLLVERLALCHSFGLLECCKSAFSLQPRRACS